VGYGLSGLLVKAGVIDRRTDPYPFLPLLAVVWLPITVWLLWVQRRSQELDDLEQELRHELEGREREIERQRRLLEQRTADESRDVSTKEAEDREESHAG